VILDEETILGDEIKVDVKWIKKIKKEHFIDFNTTLVTQRDGVYLVERTGKCEPKKCKSICCKFIHWDASGKQFGTNFGTHCRKTGGTIIKIKCKHLKNGRCNVWKKGNFPLACRQFPMLKDSHYHVVMDECTFKFKARKINQK